MNTITKFKAQVVVVLTMLLVTSATAWATDVTLSGSYTAQDGDVLTGSTGGTVTIADGASITLSDVTITGGIVCAGTATITLVGTNSVTVGSGSGIKIGGAGTTLTIKGDGSLTATGAEKGAGIGMGELQSDIGMAKNSFGNIVIEGGTVTATGGDGGAGIGMGKTEQLSLFTSTYSLDNITINGGTVTAIGGNESAGIGGGSDMQGIVTLGNITINGGTVTAIGNAGGIGSGCILNGGIGTITIAGGTVTAIGDQLATGIGTLPDEIYEAWGGSCAFGGVKVYDTIDLVNASNIRGGVTYIHGSTDVTANATDYFNIVQDASHYIITNKENYPIIIANGINHGTITGSGYAKCGQKVTMTATPDDGYYFSRLIVKDSQNNDVAVEANSFYMPNDHVTVSAEFVQDVELSGDYTAQDGDALTGSTDGTVTIPDGACVTLNNATITGGIVCEGTAAITLVGENKVDGASTTAGIQVGGTGTTLTIRGDGTLRVTSGYASAAIGLSLAMDETDEVTGGNIIIEGGDIYAVGQSTAIGTGMVKNSTVSLGDISIKGGTVTAQGYINGIGKGGVYESGSCSVGAVKVYTGIDKLDIYGGTDDITYMCGNYDVTASAADFFDITVEDIQMVIKTDIKVVLADGSAYNWIYTPDVNTATYHKTIGEERVGKHQAWFVPFDYTITDDDLDVFTFYKINMIANAPDPSTEASDEMWVFLKKLNTGDVLRGNMPYVYKPKQAVTDYAFTTTNTTLKAKETGVLITMTTAEDTYTVYGTYENTTPTASAPFYYVNINGELSLGNDGTVTVGPYRWIIRKESKFGGTTAYAPAMHFFDGDSETTSLNEELRMKNEDFATAEWYDLSGRKLDKQPTQKGVYIHGGRKVVIK